MSTTSKLLVEQFKALDSDTLFEVINSLALKLRVARQVMRSRRVKFHEDFRQPEAEVAVADLDQAKSFIMAEMNKARRVMGLKEQ